MQGSCNHTPSHQRECEFSTNELPPGEGSSCSELVRPQSGLSTILRDFSRHIALAGGDVPNAELLMQLQASTFNLQVSDLAPSLS